jgi:hypothetical protein
MDIVDIRKLQLKEESLQETVQHIRKIVNYRDAKKFRCKVKNVSEFMRLVYYFKKREDDISVTPPKELIKEVL